MRLMPVAVLWLVTGIIGYLVCMRHGCHSTCAVLVPDWFDVHWWIGCGLRFLRVCPCLRVGVYAMMC